MKDLKNLSDEEVVELVRSSDQELYRQLVRRYQNKLLRYANYLVRDEESAADVVQEAFIKAFINLKGFNTKKKFSSWIYRIVHNEAVNYLKRSKKVMPFAGRGWLAEGARSRTDLENEFLRKEKEETIRRGLASLPLKYREPLALFYFEEKSYEEISDILRMPIGTVGTRINRGKRMLRNLFEEAGQGPAVT